MSGVVYEPSQEKTNNLGFLPGLTNICLYSPRFKKLENHFTIPVLKRKALISCTVTAHLTCAFGFAYADCWFCDAAAHIMKINCSLMFIT